MATIAEALAQALHCHQAGQLQQAERIYRQVLQVDPRHADALHLLGVIALQVGQHQPAIDHIRQAIALDPYNATYQSNLGSALAGIGRFEEAAASFRGALVLNPQFADAHNNLGSAQMKLGRLDEAVASFRRAIQLRPTYADAYNNLGSALQEMDRLEEAAASYRQALRLKPDYADARYNLAVALGKLGQLDLALGSYEQAIRLRPEHADAHNNLGNVLRELGRFDEALAAYEAALRLRPDFPLAHKNRGMAWLRMGDFERGWPEYEWRWRCDDSPPRQFSQPMWDGSSPEGRTILLHAEQGLGDTLQFIRYAPLVHQRGGRVLLECQSPLMLLLAQAAGVDALIERGQPLPEFDIHAPLLSLPGIFRTTLETIPAQVPYLQVDPERVQHWHRELAGLDGFTVGINWQGNPKFRGDRYRSIPLAHFEPLARIPGIRLISLQYGPGTEQLTAVGGRFEVTQLPADADSARAFVDTAAIMRNLDLIITSDTSTAHLAGALGLRVWTAIPFSADWRWLLAREDSPWYPTMRLFRPSRPVGWEELFQRIAAELAAVAEEGRI
jgi:tetratricopeptide (TPR) repeat protein